MAHIITDAGSSQAGGYTCTTPGGCVVTWSSRTGNFDYWTDGAIPATGSAGRELQVAFTTGATFIPIPEGAAIRSNNFGIALIGVDTTPYLSEGPDGGPIVTTTGY